MRLLLSVAFFCVLASSALAHKPSDSYLRLARTSTGVRAEWDVALYDLELALGLDGDASGTLRYGEVVDARERIVAEARRALVLRNGAHTCTLRDGDRAFELVSHSDGPYLRLPLDFSCAEGGEVTLAYSFLFARDAQHRVVVQQGSAANVLSKQRPNLTLGKEHDSLSLVAEGVHHIFAGLDHLLFLFALMLPLWFGDRGGRPAIRTALRDVLKVVTAFTLAHSLTLSLAVFGMVQVAASVVEPAIAATVAIAALLNFREQTSSRAALAFGLGLLHGFGFSSALADLGLAGPLLARALLAFNLGVEAGQMAVVLALLAVGSLIARFAPPPRALLRASSLGLLAVSLFWLFERLQQG